jgi:hypothetical protein
MADQQEEFDKQLANLNHGVADLAIIVNDTFPDGYILDPEISGITGDSREPPMKLIATRIDDVLGWFDCLQKAIGLPDPRAGTRHEWFLEGRCGG